MPEFPLVVSFGVDKFEGVGIFIGSDGSLYHQDADGNRTSITAALSGVLTNGADFIALGHTSSDGYAGGGYGDHTPPITHGVHAMVHSTGPADASQMLPGNWAAHLDLENSELVFSAIDDDGNVITGSLALA